MTTDTLNHEASTTSTATVALDPSPAFRCIGGPSGLARPLDDASRCHFRYPNGRRCTLPGLLARSGLCLRHYNRQIAAGLPLAPSPSDSADLSAELLPELSESFSAVDPRKFLTRLLVLVTQGRISPRRASVLAYITSQLLHSPAPSQTKPPASHFKSSLLRLAQEVRERTSP